MKNKIIKLQIAKNKNFAWLSTEDGGLYYLTVDLVVKHKLKAGDEISTLQLNELTQNSNKIRLKNKAFQLIGIRQRSEAELVQRLTTSAKLWQQKYKTRVDLHLITDIIQELKQEAYIDDWQFALDFAHHKVAAKKIGPIALKVELMKKQIDSKIINKILALEDLYSRDNTHNLIYQSIEKIAKIINSRKLDKLQAKKMLISRLASKGFAYQQIKPQIDDWLSKQYNS